VLDVDEEIVAEAVPEDEGEEDREWLAVAV
jgi:hypothetical protein